VPAAPQCWYPPWGPGAGAERSSAWVQAPTSRRPRVNEPSWATRLFSLHDSAAQPRASGSSFQLERGTAGYEPWKWARHWNDLLIHLGPAAGRSFTGDLLSLITRPHALPGSRLHLHRLVAAVVYRLLLLCVWFFGERREGWRQPSNVARLQAGTEHGKYTRPCPLERWLS